jgi:hypothetical protein
VSETPEQDHEHSLVWVTSPDTTQARQYCRECGHRTEWQELPPELQPHGDLLEDDPGPEDFSRRLEDDLIELDRTR